MGSLNLSNLRNKLTIKEEITVKGDVDLRATLTNGIQNNLKVKGDLFLDATTLSINYSGSDNIVAGKVYFSEPIELLDESVSSPSSNF